MEIQSASMKDQDPVAADDDGVHRSSSIIIAVDGGAPVLQSTYAQTFDFDHCCFLIRPWMCDWAAIPATLPVHALAFWSIIVLFFGNYASMGGYKMSTYNFSRFTGSVFFTIVPAFPIFSIADAPQPHFTRLVHQRIN